MLGLQQRLSQTLQDRILEVTVQTCNCQYHRTQFAVGKRPSIAGRKQVASPLIDVAVPEIAYDAQSPVQALDQLRVNQTGGNEVIVSASHVVFGVEAGVSDKQREPRRRPPVCPGECEEVLDCLRRLISVVELVVDVFYINDRHQQSLTLPQR